jgi:hypothetical protein
MGRIDKQFCDWNGEPLTGVGFKLRLSDGSVHAVDMELCGACYSTWMTYLKTRMDEIGAAWVVNPAAIIAKAPK